MVERGGPTTWRVRCARSIAVKSSFTCTFPQVRPLGRIHPHLQPLLSHAELGRGPPGPRALSSAARLPGPPPAGLRGPALPRSACGQREARLGGRLVLFANSGRCGRSFNNQEAGGIPCCLAGWMPSQGNPLFPHLLIVPAVLGRLACAVVRLRCPHTLPPGTCRHRLPSAGGVAWGSYLDSLHTRSNFGQLRVTTSGEHPDADQLYAAGYLEGYLTAHRIWDNWVGAAKPLCRAQLCRLPSGDAIPSGMCIARAART